MFSTDSSKYLINNPKYRSFLQPLGLEEENLGVYDGQWFANGQVLINHSESKIFR